MVCLVWLLERDEMDTGTFGKMLDTVIVLREHATRSVKKTRFQIAGSNNGRATRAAITHSIEEAAKPELPYCGSEGASELLSKYAQRHCKRGKTRTKDGAIWFSVSDCCDMYLSNDS